MLACAATEVVLSLFTASKKIRLGLTVVSHGRSVLSKGSMMESFNVITGSTTISIRDTNKVQALSRADVRDTASMGTDNTSSEGTNRGTNGAISFPFLSPALQI